MGCGSSTNVKVQKNTYKKKAPFHLTSRIAIIGGGAGGLHMAYELKKKGYEYITVFEKQSEEGKFFAVEESKSFDTGTSAPDSLVDTLLKDTFKDMELLNSKETQEYSRTSNCLLSKLDMAKEVTGITSSSQLQLTLESQISRFESIYRKMVDKYGFPKEECMSEMVKPVGQFFEDHGLHDLGSLVNARLKSQGYDRGFLTTFYALFYLDPKYLQPNGISLRLENLFEWQDVWKRISIHNIHVEYNKYVDSVELVADHTLKLQIKDLLMDMTYSDSFDFCILAIPNPLKLMTCPSELQFKYLSRYDHFYSVLSTTYKCANKANIPLIFDYQSDNMVESQTGVCLYRKEDMAVAHMYFKNDYEIKRNQVAALESSLFKQIEFLTKETVLEKIHTKISNQYLPHCSAEDVSAGVPWELFKLQGEGQMWYTSALTSFDLTQCIINYNRKLLAQYDM